MTFADGDTVVSRTIMENGVRVISQEVPATRSVGISMWVPVGSRDEIISQAGSTHFLEHLLFKGTSTRSALDIAAAFDSVGGESNASTGKETTNYWARILDADVPMAVSVLTNMLTDSILDPAAFEMERSVIIDELAMSDDSPTDVVHDAFHSAVYGESVLARPVGGTPEIIRAVTRDDVWAHYMSHYSPNNLIVAAAGHINHDHLLERVRDALAQSPWADKKQTSPRPPEPARVQARAVEPPNHLVCPQLSWREHQQHTNWQQSPPAPPQVQTGLTTPSAKGVPSSNQADQTA
ncbi:MAG: hypothetical protein CSB13_09410 [Chloroflexi bacterium]|nr:MAG: hypothetical protein CSB13_09410 [Chloroflexota bacterium]